MKTAITGACGYVGLNLVQALIDAGHEVLALDRVNSPHLHPQAKWRQLDIFDTKAVRQAFADIDVVYHLVAKISLLQEDEATWHINTQGVKAVAEAALESGVRRMVHVSSIASFDPCKIEGMLTETAERSTDRDLYVYARSKYAGEQELMKVVERGLEGVVCYPTGVMGPIDHCRPLSRINATLLDSAAGRMPAMVAGGFDLVDVRDVANGLVLAAKHGRNGENYFLGGAYVEMIEAYRMAARMVGRRGPRVTLSIRPLKAIAPPIEWLLSKLKVDADFLSEVALSTIETSPRVNHGKASRELGYLPRPLDESIRDLMTFFIQNQQLQARNKKLAEGLAR